MPCEPSRFLQEIDSQHLESSIGGSGWGGAFSNAPSGFMSSNAPDFGGSRSSGFSKAKGKSSVGKRSSNFTRMPAGKGHKVSADFTPSPPEAIVEGVQVEHPKFGMGKVKAVDADGASRKATVEFDNVGEKTLILSFAKLMVRE